MLDTRLEEHIADMYNSEHNFALTLQLGHDIHRGIGRSRHD